MSNLDSFWDNQLRRLRDRFVSFASTGRRLRLRLSQSPRRCPDASLIIEDCPNEWDRPFFEASIIGSSMFGPSLHRNFVLCKHRDVSGDACEEYCRIADEAGKAILEAPAGVRAVLGADVLNVKDPILRWYNAIFELAWRRRPGSVFSAERFVLVEPDFLFALSERLLTPETILAEADWKDRVIELRRLKAQLRGAQVACKQLALSPSPEDESPERPDVADAFNRYQERHGELVDAARSRIPVDPQYFSSVMLDVVESSIAAIDWLLSDNDFGEFTTFSSTDVVAGQIGAGQSLQSLIHAIDSIDVCRSRANDADERSRSAGLPVAGSRAAALAIQSDHWQKEMNSAIAACRRIPGAEMLRTICTAHSKPFDGPAVRQIAASTALQNRMTLHDFLDLNVDQTLGLMSSQIVATPAVGNSTETGPSNDFATTDAIANNNPSDAARRPSAIQSGDSADTADIGGVSQHSTFVGGEMVFYADRVELCGTVICRVSRGRQGFNALRLLARKENGEFVAYSAEQLAAKSGSKHAPGLVRGLRTRIRTALAMVDIPCGDEDVVLSGGPGYRFADSISVSVQCGDAPTPPEILVHNGSCVRRDGPINPRGEPINEPINSADEPIFEPIRISDNELDDADSTLAVEAEIRQAAILKLLREHQGLRVPAIVTALGYSNATVKRDITDLVANEKIRFDGAKKTGGYVLIGKPSDQAVKRTSRSAKTTSASGPNAEST